MSSKPNSLLKNYFKAKMHFLVGKLAEETVHVHLIRYGSFRRSLLLLYLVEILALMRTINIRPGLNAQKSHSYYLSPFLLINIVLENLVFHPNKLGWGKYIFPVFCEKSTTKNMNIWNIWKEYCERYAWLLVTCCIKLSCTWVLHVQNCSMKEDIMRKLLTNWLIILSCWSSAEWAIKHSKQQWTFRDNLW